MVFRFLLLVALFMMSFSLSSCEDEKNQTGSSSKNGTSKSDPDNKDKKGISAEDLKKIEELKKQVLDKAKQCNLDGYEKELEDQIKDLETNKQVIKSLENMLKIIKC